MALLNLKKGKTKKAESGGEKAKPISAEKNVSQYSPKEAGDIILRPLITEKATFKQEQNTYVFVVSPRATKALVSQSFEKVYKIKPLRVNISSLPRKNMIVRGKRGVKTGLRKAYIFLKKGDKIDIV